MSLVGRLLERRNISLSDLDRWMDDHVLGERTATYTGKHLSISDSLQCVAVFACVRVLAETIGSLPLHLLRDLSDGSKEKATRHPLYQRLHAIPNDEMTAMQMWTALVGHDALWGNCYSYIERDNAERIIGLWPLRPDRMQDIRRVAPGKLEYLYRLKEGEPRILDGDKILHIPGLTHDGLVGYSPIQQAREAVALALGAEEYGSRFLGNDSSPGGVLQHPGKLSSDGRKKLAETWEHAHRGLEKHHRVAVLEEGMTWQSIGIPPVDAQFIESRKYQLGEVSRLFRIPPHMIGDVERSTSWGTGIEQQSIGFVVYTIVPWLVAFEQAINKSLLTEAERQAGYYAKFSVEGLLRGDMAARKDFYATGRQWGWFSANDVRRFEDMNPIKGGDTYLVPLNMVPADSLGEAQQDKDQERALRALVAYETRSGSAESRRRIGKQYARLFEEATGRIVKREVQDVGKIAEKWLGKRDLYQFKDALEDFYRDYGSYIERTMLPVLLSYADAIAVDAGQEIATDAAMDAGLERFMADYAANMAADWVYSSRGQIEQIATEAQHGGGDPAEAVNARLNEWGETRAQRSARQHVTEAAGAATVYTWSVNGVRRIRWRGSGCPYCRALDSRVIEIDSYFVRKGEPQAAEGAEVPLTPSRSVRHAPLHGGCECGIAPA